MSDQIVPFEFGGEQVRVIGSPDYPQFVTADVLAILDLDRTALRRLDDEDKGVASIHTPGGMQEMATVSEPGLYDLVLGSRKPEARKFKRWVTGEVLPAIRKTGSYGVQRTLTNDEIVAQALQITVAKVAELEAKVVADAPKVDYVETFVADTDLRILRNVAKSIGMQEAALRADLIERKWIYQEKSTRWSEKEQQKVSHDRYSAYADKTRYFTPVPTHDAPRFRGEVMHTLKVTPAGAVAIARLYGKHLVAVAS